jgi:hypothetical protein
MKLDNIFNDREIHEECGVFGIHNVPNDAEITYYALHSLQHRGQEGCGLVACDENKKFSIPAQILPQGVSGKITDLYSGDDVGFLDSDTPFTVELPPHSAKIYCIGNK